MNLCIVVTLLFDKKHANLQIPIASVFISDFKPYKASFHLFYQSEQLQNV